MNSTKIQILRGHTSPETAYVVNDYPYGFTLRCKIRYWLEYRKGHGTRFCSQTTNPKVAGEVWNKPKRGIYMTGLTVMYKQPDTGYIGHDTCGVNNIGGMAQFQQKFDLNQKELSSLAVLEQFSRKLNSNSWADYELKNGSSHVEISVGAQ